MTARLVIVVLLLCSSTFAWAQAYQDYLGLGHDQGITVSTSSSYQTELGENTLNGINVNTDLAQTARFLAHSTFGANHELIEAVDQQGYEAWLEEQFALEPTYVTPAMEDFIDRFQAEEEELRYFLGTWWHLAITAEDQLRHRVALALSEILVVSIFQAENAYGPASYHDVLVEHALGNYRDLLFDVSMHPIMGQYLSHYNNPKAIPAYNIRPDENYAREIMQLFSIGLFKLNPDGTRKLDNNGNPIPTYDNEDIRQMARVFTGLGPGEFVPEAYEESDYTEPAFGAPFYFIDPTVPMKVYSEWHEPGAKVLLKEKTLPAGQTGLKDINDAIDFLFNHPNVGPFISKQLIQRLVKSNPTPEYVGRVAAAFANNGQGVRGDMKAVVKAILMDAEARNCNSLPNPVNGRLKEPIIRYTQLLRGFDITNEEDAFILPGFELLELTQQNVLSSPTVFNFFQPDFQPNGPIAEANLVGPEYQILNSVTSIGYINLSIYWTLGEAPMLIEGLPSNGDEVTFNSELQLEDELALADNPIALVDRLNLILCHGQMTQRTHQIITKAVQQIVIPEGKEEQDHYRVLFGLYLTMISPDYVVMR